MKNNHVWIPSAIPFFLFGYFYYLISPIFAVLLYDDYPLLSAAKTYIDISFFNYRYFLDIIFILVFWLFGYFFAQKLKFKKKSILDTIESFSLTPKILVLGLVFFLFLLIITALLNGTVFFSGYTNYDISVLGPFATMITISVWFLNYFAEKRVKILFLFIFFVSSLIMLGLGSRMFFVLGSITIILGFLATHKKTLYNPFFYIVIVFLVLMVLSIGSWRSGGDLSAEIFVAVFFAEPLFTATSASMYFENVGGRPFISFPSDVLASIVNFLPSIIFPGKLDVINQLIYNENKFSPFGANALIVNIYSNFGIFFPIYFFIIGFFIGFIRRKANNIAFYRATYFAILPLLMFHFYREGFVTVLKVMFYNAIILPSLIIILLIIVFRKKPHYDDYNKLSN